MLADSPPPLDYVNTLLVTADNLSAYQSCPIETVIDTDDGYRIRGDRCEGIYAIEVAGDIMKLLSLTSYFHEVPRKLPTIMQLSWRPHTGDLTITGRGDRLGVYYALDTVVAASEGVFQWPGNILIGRGFERSNIGFLAWHESDTDKVYVPLTVSHNGIQERHQPDSSVYTIAVRTGDRFIRMYSSIDRIYASKSVTIDEHKELGRSYYSRKKILHTFNISGPHGLYRLTLQGERDNRTFSRKLEIYFQHSPQEVGT